MKGGGSVSSDRRQPEVTDRPSSLLIFAVDALNHWLAGANGSGAADAAHRASEADEGGFDVIYIGFFSSCPQHL